METDIKQQQQQVMVEDVRIIKTKPNMLKFIIQSAFGLIVLIFSAVQIMMRPDEPNQIWVGLICTVAGIFFPHPTPTGGNSEGGPGEPSSSSHDMPMNTTTVITTPRPSQVNSAIVRDR